MFDWPRRSLLPGWVGCVPQGAQWLLACVERPSGERPVLRWVDEAEALPRLRRTRELQRHRLVAVVPRGQYQCLPMDAPADVPREDWAGAMRWQLRDVVDFPVEAAAVQVLAVPEQASSRPQPQLIAVAAAHEALRGLIDPARAAGLDWGALDIAETALRNLSALVAPAGRAHALLHVDGQQGLLVVTYDGELLMSRQIDATATALAHEDEAVRTAAWDRAGLELQRTLDGVERQFSRVELSELRITPMPGVEAFCDHLRELLYVPVAALQLAEALDLSAVPALADSPERLHAHLGAIGAALRQD